MSAPTAPQVRYIPAQPAKLLLADREVAVDDWPLARSVAPDRSVDVLRDDANALEIGPTHRAGRRLVGGYVAALAVGALSPVVVLALEGPWWLAAAMLALIAGVVALVIRGSLRGLTWVRFDRAAGELVTERRAGFRDRREVVDRLPLSAVVAIQLLYSGYHTSYVSTGDAERPATESRAYYGYELNLVLDGPAGPRRLLFALSDWGWLRSAGGRVGEYLGVPVIDRLCHG